MAQQDDGFLLMLLFLGIIGATKKRGGRALGPEWTLEEMFIFSNSVKHTGVPVPAALSVYTAESNLNPKAVNPKTQASGLAQIMPSTLRELGYSEGPIAFRKLGVADQTPWVVKLLEYQIKSIGFVPKSALDLYVANLSPAAARAHSDVIYSRDVPAQVDAYNANAGLDTGNKGTIDRSDLQRVINSIEQSETYKRALEQSEKMP